MIVEAREDAVRLYGELRENQWLTIKAVTNLLLKRYPSGIIIDCTHLDDVTSEGGETFLDAIYYIEAANARIVVASLPDKVLATLRAVPGLRSRLPIAATVDEARRSLQMGGRADTSAAVEGTGILVPLLYPETVSHATTTACRLGKDSRADIHLAYLLVVPRNMPLNTPRPEAEAEAGRMLDMGEAICKRFGLRSFRHLHRVRDRNEGVIQLVDSLKIMTLVLSRPPDRGHDAEDAVEQVARRAHCAVIIDQMPSPL